ncbi:hypothetical protein AG1IA_10267 [Rhizoctonia solani AG-1 IA]|uniref:Uncharacterized protein n=1 Tax=Thanatephorus cucumeris (strain AG1-IA) TaxID=983506 RepID=L8WFZ4_THACA|nr:hypothetical protein AG1IA_10267 [Rhizoctonia solani AG-1 IA]
MLHGQAPVKSSPEQTQSQEIETKRGRSDSISMFTLEDEYRPDPAVPPRTLRSRSRSLGPTRSQLVASEPPLHHHVEPDIPESTTPPSPQHSPHRAAEEPVGVGLEDGDTAVRRRCYGRQEEKSAQEVRSDHESNAWGAHMRNAGER